MTIILFAGMLVFANSKGFLDGAKNAVTVLISPIGSYFSDVGSNFENFFSSIFNISNLQEENAQLSSEVNELRAEVARLNEVQSENKSLRHDLDFVEKSGFEYIPATVMAYDPANVRGMVTVYKGKKDGIEVGMAAVSEGYLIGRAYEVGDNYTKIILITDPTSAIPVSIQNTNTNGLARGELGSGLSMEKIPQGEKVSIGDIVITSGLGGEIPRGIIIGKIENIDSNENSLFITASIRPQANLGNVLRVLFIKN